MSPAQPSLFFCSKGKVFLRMTLACASFSCFLNSEEGLVFYRTVSGGSMAFLGNAPDSNVTLGELVVPIFWHSMLNESPVKFSIT